ncbi:MAG: methyl-accepting chemotaxis protein [Lachnospiraceae bacterium]
MKNRYRRMGATVMTVVTLATSLVPAQAVLAGEVSASVDEAMYVNLDYYGQIDKVNMVKSISLNGTSSFTDYGDYTDVTNMTDHTEPVLGDGSVTWNFAPDQNGRFYYKGVMKNDQVTLPWTFDVSYKLNGVPTDADKLAGASGTVEIHIDATANENAREYYRNNMMLAVAVLVDLTKCYSVEADGAQVQNIGSQTGVVFTALPGEDGDYTVRIGSDSFESDGVLMTMIPGTTKDLEHVKDLKDAKDTWKEAGDQLYDSMEQMALSVESMRDGVNDLQSGLGSAENARGVWSGSKDNILDNNDKALASLTAVSEQMQAMVPHIESAKESAEIVHDSLGDIVNSMREMQDPLRKLNTSLRGIKSNTEDLAAGIAPLNQLMQTLIALDATLQSSEQIYVTQLASLGVSLEQVENDYYDGDVDLIDDVNASAQTATPSSATAAGIPGVTLNTQQLLIALTQKKAYLEKLSSASTSLAGKLSSLLDDTSDASRSMGELVDEIDFILEDSTALYDSLETYYSDFQLALDDSEELVNRTTNALDTSVSTLTLIQNTMRASSDSLDAAARDSIRGSMEVLDKSLRVLDSTTSMRMAGRTMKDTMDREWDDLDGDTRFLYMDPSAEKVSFTSDQNEEPDTLQVILRTKEISLDDDDEVLNAESAKASEGPLKRMWNVLVKMVQAIIEIFKNR